MTTKQLITEENVMTNKISGQSWTPPEDTLTTTQQERFFLLGIIGGAVFAGIVLLMGTFIVPVVLPVIQSVTH